MIDVARRHLASSPGMNLLLGDSAEDVIRHFDQWRRATWMEPEDFLPNTLANVPLPIYSTPEAGRPRFSGVNPQAMWHPLFWLPERLGCRYELPHSNGGTQIEATDMWSIRVALEMTASALYDPTEGWVDILALHGLSVDDPNDVQRVAAWQAGGADKLLDGINLEDHLRVEDDPHWSLSSAAGLLDSYTRARLALHSNSLIEMLDEARSAETGKEMREDTRMAAVIAKMLLNSIPDEDPGAAASFWDKVENAATAGSFPSRQDFTDGPLRASADYLTGIRDRYWSAVDELKALETV